ncbi:Putative uncharacterized protein [Moritella viscosa]|uniref:N-acetylmuramoyl-L-alanine amidase-like domain-containing protein n=1 Tax=Moritella viscosa TaxID=80854 RepID=UPI000917AB7E|nr:N-acetylmuramoyl-L-alanine amidase-like domain-containing protein [Moritella viscosa]SGZ10874.1 Putative uncharacterized protein [Moritella viscosa]
MKLKILSVYLIPILLSGVANSVTLKNVDANVISKVVIDNYKMHDFDFYASDYETKANKLNHILNSNKEDNKKIQSISKLFLNTPYVRNRLIGSNKEPEQLVADFQALDCFTFLDYVEALRKSDNLSDDFSRNLIRIRYKNDNVDYLSRKHFFSDWSYVDSHGNRNAEDVTTSLTNNTKTISKELNEKEDGGRYLNGLQVIHRVINYIPGKNINQNVINNLKNGDYIGIYTNIKGLDVTHTGIFINGKNGPVFRNASSLSKNMKVVDTPFLEYTKEKPGIVVYRAI